MEELPHSNQVQALQNLVQNYTYGHVWSQLWTQKTSTKLDVIATRYPPNLFTFSWDLFGLLVKYKPQNF